jgi:hypothetical protein
MFFRMFNVSLRPNRRGFLDLPAELRNRIYNMVLRG